MGNEYNDLGGSINFDVDFRSEKNYYIEDGIKFLKADSILMRLTGDHSLHAGDKFSVYCENYTDFPTKYIADIGTIYNISNFNNITENKITSPKNRLYTLSLGILNS
jgi:hypothetical protein